MDYFSAIKSDKILMQATAWMKSPGNHAEWKKQSPRVTYCMVLFLGHSLKDRATGLGNRSVVARVRGTGRVQLQRGSMGDSLGRQSCPVLWWQLLKSILVFKSRERGLPGDPVAKTPRSQCGGEPGQGTRSHMLQQGPGVAKQINIF